MQYSAFDVPISIATCSHGCLLSPDLSLSPRLIASVGGKSVDYLETERLMRTIYEGYDHGRHRTIEDADASG